MDSNLPKSLKEIIEILPAEDRDSLRNIPVDMQASFMRIRASQVLEAKAQAEEIKEAILPGGLPPVEQLRFSFAPFPTELTRTSPFFPMSKNEMAKREYIKDLEIAKHAWGSLTYAGPKLSVYDEDVLLIILALLNDSQNRTVEELNPGELSYTFKGSIKQILQLRGIFHHGKNHYNAVIDSLTYLAGANFKLTTGKGDKKTTYVNNIVSNFKYETGTGELTVTINPYFYETYASGFVTWLDVRLRAEISSPIAKALYRFVSSHRDDEWYGPAMTLAAALNLDLELPKNKLRERIKLSINDLIELKVLLPESKIAGDAVSLYRVKREKSTKKISVKPKQLK